MKGDGEGEAKPSQLPQQLGSLAQAPTLTLPPTPQSRQGLVSGGGRLGRVGGAGGGSGSREEPAVPEPSSCPGERVHSSLTRCQPQTSSHETTGSKHTWTHGHVTGGGRDRGRRLHH